jgi:ubiquinone/menaquinone biosynthesis C-methylase UbiE
MSEVPASVQAYDHAGRVSAYDADMEIMHPLRARMAQVVLELLPWPADEPMACVDLGVGTGYLTARLLERFPQARVVAVDGAAAMVDLCRTRLGASAARVEFVISDFERIPSDAIAPGSMDAVVSAFALHHLGRAAKRDLMALALSWLKPGGWFLNADLVVARDAAVEERLQSLRAAGIVDRARGDARFPDAATTRAFLSALEVAEHDQPLPLENDLAAAREAGFTSPEVFWKEYRETVWGGRKP